MLSFIDSKEFLNSQLEAQDEISKSIDKSIIDTMFNFVAENKLVMSDSLTISNYSYLIYAEFALRMANNLSNIIAEKHTIFVEMITNIKYKDFTIKINNSLLINIVDISHIDNILLHTYGIIEYEMMCQFHKSYLLQFYSEWKSCISWIDMNKNMKITNHNTPKPLKYTEDLIKFSKLMDDVIITGAVANTFHDKKLRTTYKPQFMTKYPLAFIDQLKSSYKNINSREITINIPSDFRLKIYSIIINGEHVADIFNNLSYEIVPYYLIDGFKVSNYRVSMRFIYVYILQLRRLIQMKVLSEQLGNNIISHIKKSDHGEIDEQNMTLKFMGIYKNEVIEKRKQKLSDSFIPYYPTLYKNNNKDYRHL
jgi:hypothetical protein